MQHETGDLIDFSDDPAPAASSDPLKTPQAQPAPRSNASLLSELQPHTHEKDPIGPIKRQDTDSNEDEIFVNAED